MECLPLDLMCMKKNRSYFVILLLFGSLVSSCYRSDISDSALLRADSLMQSSPDSALSLLKSITPTTLSKSERIYHGLLLTQAMDKCYMPLLPCDSLIDAALEYYGGGVNRAKALLYKERIQMKMNLPKMAMENCFEALGELKGSSREEMRLKALIYGDLGLIYSEKELEDKALEQFRKSYSCDSVINNEKGMIASLINMGVVYSELNDQSPTMMCYDKATVLAKQLNDSSSLGVLFHDLSLYYRSKNQLDTALTYAHQSLPFYSERSDSISSFLSIGYLYYQKDQLDSASYYLMQSVDARDDKIRAMTCQVLSDIEEQNNNLELALHYQKEYGEALCLIDDLKEASDIERLVYKYEADFHVRKEKGRMWFLLLAVLSGSSISVLLLILVYQRRLGKQKMAKLLYVEETERLKKDISQFILEMGCKDEELKNKEDEIRKLTDEKGKLSNARFRETLIYSKIQQLSLQNFRKKKELNVLLLDEQDCLRRALFEIYKDYIGHLRTTYSKITDKDCIYCCLRLCDFDDSTIALCFGNTSKQLVVQRRLRLRDKMEDLVGQ